MKLYEGVLIEVRDIDAILYVKGLSHEQGYVLALPRYVPHEEGTKVMPDGQRFAVLKSFSEQIRYAYSSPLRKYIRYSHVYGQELPLIPLSEITKVYDPVERAREIRSRPRTPVEHIAAELLDLVLTCVSKDHVGVIGSLLAGFVSGVEDIDIVVLDVDEGLELVEYLRELKKQRPSLFKLTKDVIEKLYAQHFSTIKTTPELFRKLWESRVLEGCFRGVPYFMRVLLMRKSSPLLRIIRTRKLSKLTVNVRISSHDVFTVTTPCLYECALLGRRILALSDRGVFTETLALLREFVLVNVDVEYARLVLCDQVIESLILYLGPTTRVVPS